MENYTTEKQFGTVPKEIKKEEIYLDLIKLSEEEVKEVISILPSEEYEGDYDVGNPFIFLIFDTDLEKYWVTRKKWLDDKIEISLSQFKELFQTSAENAQVETITISVAEIEKMIADSKIENKRSGDYRIALR